MKMLAIKVDTETLKEVDDIDLMRVRTKACATAFLLIFSLFLLAGCDVGL